MRILSITAGAGAMYCGSCIRDNALAAGLLKRGHDVVLVPLYTPTLTDEPNVSARRVFFGGISIYLQQHLSLFRRLPAFLDRLWDSAAILRAAARRSIRTDPRMLGELTVSVLKAEEGFQRKEIAKLLGWLETQARPDVISLPYTLLIGLARPLKRALQRPVCCTLQGEDLFLDGLPEPYRAAALDLIRANLEHVDAFLPVSEYYARFMADYLDIPGEKMHVLPLGINLDGYQTKAARGEVFTVGYFARIAEEKGLYILCGAYHRLRQYAPHRPARLEVAGYLAPEHRVYLRGLERRMKGWGLGAEFSYRGVLDRERKLEFLRSLDVLSVPSTYQDPKGLYVLEAMASGVPVVQPRAGAFPEMIEKTGGGLLFDPDDIEGLVQGLLTLWHDPALAADLGRRGADGVRRHYSAAAMAERAEQIFRLLASPAPTLN